MQEQPGHDANPDVVGDTKDALYWISERRALPWHLEKLASERSGDFGFESVAEAEQAIKDFRADTDRRDRVLSLFDELARMHIDAFLAKCAPACTSQEKSALIGLVFVYLETGRFDRVTTLIEDVAQHGPAIALKRNAKFESGGAAWHILAGIWATIEIIVVLFMIAAVDRGFQTLVVGSLVFMYAGLSLAITSGNYYGALAAFGQAADLQRIRLLHNDRLADTDEIRLEFDKAATEIRKASVRRWIYIVKLTVMELVGVVAILRTVFLS
jgi:hypothetical protein